ncbi:MAG: iron-sulfur cluster assembly scaffold protein [Patescibacteria group bacterium]
MYNKKILEHFTHPKFFGKIENPDVIGKAGNPRCGDLLTLYLKVDEKTEKIKEIRFETLGCAAAVAASDMICQIAKGKTLEQAVKIGFQDVSNELGVLPPLKIHCAQLVTEALRDAINNYLPPKADK